MERGGGSKAPLTGCSIIKRGGNLLESKLPIIPYGPGAQTSFRDQLQSMDGLGLRLLLYETRPEPKHKIFLSHSGAQKSFVKQLCKDIERYDRYPFFDVLRTSLSIGCDFPNAILEAIGQCQVAVVVLSEDFFSRTKWPMLELSALVKRKSHDPDLTIMPVFLGLTREQCRERGNHGRWFSLWERWAKEDRRIVLEDWTAVFKVFGSINSVSLSGWDEVKCREDIVDAVCKEVPPETRRDDSHVQGRSRLCKIIDEKIRGTKLSKSYKVQIVGLYGVGGIGKSTACMTLCNHYFKEFHGRVCHVEFGDRDELHMLQEILRRLTVIDMEQIDKLNKDECKHQMKDIKNEKILLAMDNVSESYEIVERAKFVLRSGFAKGSMVIVTARSLGELQNLNIEESECMEMPELLVDDAISLFVREVACDESTNEHLIQQCVDKCYFSKGDGITSHYHPLALRVLGGQLGSDSSQWLEKLKEIDIFNQYREKHDKHPIFSILRRSFDVLNDEDKLFFMDVVLFAICPCICQPCKYDIYQWLNMMHGKSIKSQLNGLKQKSLIQNVEEKNTGVGIHDLWREFCVLETKIGEWKSRRWIYEQWSGSNDQSVGKPSFHIGGWKRLERMSLLGTFPETCNVTLNLSRCSSLTTLDLVNVDVGDNALDLSGANNLKCLRVMTYSYCRVHGLGLLRHLCLLEWSGLLPINMDFIEEIGGLTNLQILNLVECLHNILKVPDLSNLSLLQCVWFNGLPEGNTITHTSTMTNLQYLCIEHCESLQRFNGVGDLVALEELQVSDCPNLKELPNLRGFKNLKKLDISRCSSIQALLGVGDLTTLLELRACACTNLVELPDLSKLTNLQLLDLKGCSMIKGVMGLSDLINLKTCTITINGMGESNNLHKMTKLETICVEEWSPQVSSSIDSLVNLEHLLISNCKGVDIFDGLSKVSRLWRIDMGNCEFKDVACLSNLIGLQMVYIHECMLLETFPDVHKAIGLETLHIVDCKNLQVWEGLSATKAISSKTIGGHLQISCAFPNLQYLFLSELAIMEFPDLSNFPQLKSLRINQCPSLVRLTSSVTLSWLTIFEISFCENLTTIPNLNGCKNLVKVKLWRSGVKLNTLEIENLRTMCPPIEISY